MKLKKFIAICILFSMVAGLTGCEAFVRKFTRKSKKEQAPEEMVLAPEEWKGPQMTAEEKYRQYFVFWQSWHDELINVLSQNSSAKKRNDCAQQAMKNLVNMRALLNESKQKQLDVYLRQMVDLQLGLKSDIYGVSGNTYRLAAEKLRLNILEKFSYSDIKNDLI